MPPAPPMFSTMTGWPSWLLKPSATMRAIASVDPPAAKGATIVMGRIGQSSAGAECAANTAMIKLATLADTETRQPTVLIRTPAAIQHRSLRIDSKCIPKSGRQLSHVAAARVVEGAGAQIDPVGGGEIADRHRL